MMLNCLSFLFVICLVTCVAALSASTAVAAGPKSSSLPNSPMHAVSQGEQSATKPTTKIDVAQTTRLKGEFLYTT